MNVTRSTLDEAVAAELAEKIEDLVVRYGQEGTGTYTNAYFAIAVVAGRLMAALPEDLRHRLAADLAECALKSAIVKLELDGEDGRNATKHCASLRPSGTSLPDLARRAQCFSYRPIFEGK